MLYGSRLSQLLSRALSLVLLELVDFWYGSLYDDGSGLSFRWLVCDDKYVEDGVDVVPEIDRLAPHHLEV